MVLSIVETLLNVQTVSAQRDFARGFDEVEIVHGPRVDGLPAVAFSGGAHWVFWVEVELTEFGGSIGSDDGSFCSFQFVPLSGDGCDFAPQFFHLCQQKIDVLARSGFKVF